MPHDTDAFSPPAGACDCHGHVFGPADAYPLVPGKQGPQAPVDLFLSEHAQVGLHRAISVHPSAYAFDNRALIDAIASAPEVLRGIAVPAPDVSDDELAALAGQGVRGLRFTNIGGPFAASLVGCSLNVDDLAVIGPRLARHGLHANVWGDADLLAHAAPLLTSLDCTIVLDHMAGAKAGSDDADFRRVIDLACRHGWWVKLCPIRVSRAAPDYADARGFHDMLVERMPDRLVWGSDWPFLGLTGEARPGIGALLDLLARWTPDTDMRRRILVANPARLYGFEEIA